MDRLYGDVLDLEGALGTTFAWVLHVGDFGVWPNSDRIDKASWKHDGAGDFSRWLVEKRPTPRRTLFIKGNQEDFAWLDSQPSPEILPGLLYLRNGHILKLQDGEDSIQVDVSMNGHNVAARHSLCEYAS
jgi:hypothetical protein